jgi:hypothetical protein
MTDAGIEALNSEDYLYSIAFYLIFALRLFVSFIIKGHMAEYPILATLKIPALFNG